MLIYWQNDFHGHEPRAPARGGPNNVFDSKIGFQASRKKNIDTFLYRTEGLQPHSHEQDALGLLNVESELLDLIDLAEFVQYFCDEYRAPARWGPQGPLQSFFRMDRGGDYLGG